jgi:putative ATP-binding cassette transporter
LISGLYSPSSGQIYFDDQSITGGNLTAYRQHYSVIFSDFQIFHPYLHTQREDIDTYGNQLLRQFELPSDVHMKDGKYSTMKLSLGQRKRLAMINAFLEDRDIYIFDEWASEQQSSFKQYFYEELIPALAAQGRAVLVVSHDEDFIHNATRIIRFEKGVLTEITPQKLDLSRKKHAPVRSS